MSASVVNKVRGVYDRVVEFFGREIWDRRLDDMSSRTALRYQSARIVQRIFRGLVLDDALHVRAAALTYFTVLALVPLLAFAFALLKGFGAYEMLIEDTIRPYVLELLAGNPALSESFERILGFVAQTGVTSLGFLGLVALLYAATRLLRNIEGAFNEIWGVKSARELLQQMRDYVSIIVITPICLMAAAGFATAGQAQRMLESAGSKLGVSAMLDQAVNIVGPLVALFLGLLFLYKVLPHTSVRIKSAALGAAIGAVAWYAVLIAHISFQIGVARFNALYAGFAAVPIFLAWLQISWLMVLIGAQVAATHQNGRALAQRKRLASVDQALRESLSIAVMLTIGSAFLRGTDPPRLEPMANELDVDEAFLIELLNALVEAGLIVRTEPSNDPHYVLARPAESICLKDVLDALRRGPRDMQLAAQAAAGAQAAELWQALDAASAEAKANKTIAELIGPRIERSKPGDVNPQIHAESS